MFDFGSVKIMRKTCVEERNINEVVELIVSLKFLYSRGEKK